MSYEHSYDIGRKPFLPDARRGFWNNPNDFIFVSLGLALNMDSLFMPIRVFEHMGVYSIGVHVFSAFIYVVPIVMIQSFIGQFSSSGFITMFRIAPISKGIGYMSLALNYVVLFYFAIYATVPLFFAYYSLYPTLPWNIPDNDNLTTEVNGSFYLDNKNRTTAPSEHFFRSHFADYHGDGWSFSWQLFAANVVTWSILAAIFLKYSNTEKLGTILRYMVSVVILCLAILLVRLLSLFDANTVEYYFRPTISSFGDGLYGILLNSASSFGPGFFSIATLASFNKFNTNIIRSSWIICFGHIFIFYGFTILTVIIDNHYNELAPDDTFFGYSVGSFKNYWNLYLIAGSTIGNLEFPNFWLLLFYGMLFLAAIVVMLTHLHVVSTSIFDEFEYLRKYKFNCIYCLIGSVALLSVYLCTNKGIASSILLTSVISFMQTVYNIMLLIVVLWIYGRQRLQRDFEFMLRRPIRNWQVHMYRFVTPISAYLTASFSANIFIYSYITETPMNYLISLLFVSLPHIFIPIYGIFIVLQRAGHVKARLKRACRPTDWYPVDRFDRQRYEEEIGNPDITHELHLVDDNCS